MRVLLVNAWEKGCADMNFLSPPIGLWRIKSFLDHRTNQVETIVFDPNLYDDPYGALDQIMETGPFQVLGFSPLYMTLENDISLMLYLWERNSHALFIAGGQEAAFENDFLFENTPLEVIVVGEGEKPMLEILGLLEDHSLERVKGEPTLLHHVPGLYLKGIRWGSDDGKTSHLPPLTQKEFTEATFLTDFKSIPMADYWGLLEKKYTQTELSDEEIKKKIYTIKPFTSSYCPFRCIFCSSTNFFKKASGCSTKIASLTAPDMRGYIKEILKNQPQTKTILFKDDNFFVRGPSANVKDILIQLAQVKKEYPFLSFAAKARIDTFSKHPELLALCKEAGFFFISYGVESFSRKELDYMAKGIDPETSKHVLHRTKEMGINSVAYIILTTPVTEIQDIFTTVGECVELIANGNIVKVFPHLIPIPGSLIARDETIRDLIVYEDFEIPGYNRSIKKAVKVLPRDQKARELITEYENLIDEESEKWKRLFQGKIHFVSEFSTLIKFRLLYEIAMKKKFIPKQVAERGIEKIDSIIEKRKEDRFDNDYLLSYKGGMNLMQ